MALYFIAILPPGPLRDEVRVLKEEIEKKYNSRRALRLPAHITLHPPFKMDIRLLPRLLEDLTKFANAQSSFEICLSGFGAFPPKVIYIKVANPGAVEKLHTKLCKILQKNILPNEESLRSFRPHITLATRDLSRSTFPEAWKDFQNRSFSAFFEANAIVLFQHNGKNWNILNEFNFKK